MNPGSTSQQVADVGLEAFLVKVASDLQTRSQRQGPRMERGGGVGSQGGRGTRTPGNGQVGFTAIMVRKNHAWKNPSKT